MSSRRIRLPFAAAALCLGCAGALAGESDETAAPIEISVLTPGFEGNFRVASGVDPTAFLIPVSFGHFGDRTRSTELRALVARERYDPARPFADHLIDALSEASYRAVIEPIKRKPAGSMQSLAWEDLPEVPRGSVILDVTIHWLCLCSEVAFANFYPAIGLGWRLLGEREVIEPTRHIYYRHFPPGPRKKKPAPRRTNRRKLVPNAEPKPEPEPEYPVSAVSESCGFRWIKDATENPALLWGCFAEAYDAAIQRLVIDLARVYPPRAAPASQSDVHQSRNSSNSIAPSRSESISLNPVRHSSAVMSESSPSINSTNSSNCISPSPSESKYSKSSSSSAFLSRSCPDVRGSDAMFRLSR